MIQIWQRNAKKPKKGPLLSFVLTWAWKNGTLAKGVDATCVRRLKRLFFLCWGTSTSTGIGSERSILHKIWVLGWIIFPRTSQYKRHVFPAKQNDYIRTAKRKRRSFSSATVDEGHAQLVRGISAEVIFGLRERDFLSSHEFIFPGSPTSIKGFLNHTQPGFKHFLEASRWLGFQTSPQTSSPKPPGASQMQKWKAVRMWCTPSMHWGTQCLALRYLAMVKMNRFFVVKLWEVVPCKARNNQGFWYLSNWEVSGLKFFDGCFN